MLKRYTHLRAYQLVSKLDARRSSLQQHRPPICFLPGNGREQKRAESRLTLSDFDLETSAATKEADIHASVLLLRTLAQAPPSEENASRTPGESSYKH